MVRLKMTLCALLVYICKHQSCFDLVAELLAQIADLLSQRVPEHAIYYRGAPLWYLWKHPSCFDLVAEQLAPITDLLSHRVPEHAV